MRKETIKGSLGKERPFKEVRNTGSFVWIC